MTMAGLEDQSCDVLIVGLGPVGAAIACLLGRYGVLSRVVEREENIFMAPRAIALDHEALRILQMVGVPRHAFATLAIPRVKMRCPYVGEFATINTAGEIDGHPKLVTFYQPELERALRHALAGYPSVKTHTSVELVELTQVDGHVRASVQAVASGRRATIRAKYVVGADGANSRVRRLIGQEAVGRSYVEDWLVVDAVGLKAIDHVEFLCDPARPTPHMPAPGERTRWEFMLRPGESIDAMESEQTVRALIARWAGDGDVTIERKAVYRFAARSCERYRVGRVFLAGDAAHVTPPFVGQGLVAGLRDAANLAWKLAWVVKGRACTSILDSYDQERRPHATKTIALARIMGALVMPPTRTRAVILHGAMKLLSYLLPSRELTEDLTIKPRNAYPKGLFVAGKRGLQRGTWFPQGLVHSATGAATLSDDVLGPHFALVGLGVDPLASLGAAMTAAWNAAGGAVVSLAGGAHASTQFLDEKLVPAASSGWCVVVRPDRTILHDGPAAEAERIVSESLRLLGADADARAAE